MNIEKLMRGLNIFSLDEIALIAELEEVETQNILDDFAEQGKLDFDGDFYTYVVTFSSQNKVLLNRSSHSVIEDKTFFEVCNEFLDFVRKQKSPVTYKSYKSIICGYFLPHFRACKIREIGIDDIENFMRQDFLQRLSKRTLSNALTLLGSVFKYAQQNGYIVKNPYLGIENTKSKMPSKIRVFNEDELKVIFASESAELKLFANLILRTGMKKQEILSLTSDNISLDAGIIKIEHSHFDGKIIPSNFCREIKVGQDAEPLLAWLAANSVTSPATINKRLKKEFAKLGLKAKMDDLRNNFCVEFLKTGAFSDLAKQLGMRSTEGLIKKYGGFL